MADQTLIKPVKSQPGRPLYQAARDAIRTAIDAGVYQPGQRMPSTEELGKQLEVSLVTAHRALQELVQCGVLYRAQGKGTFVHERYRERQHMLGNAKLGLVLHRECSLADFYHSQLLEGMRQGAHQLGVPLNLMRFGEEIRTQCEGYLVINPQPHELKEFTKEIGSKSEVLAVGARTTIESVHFVDVDNVDLAVQAVDHLHQLGHQSIAYVGGPDKHSNNRDRWIGYETSMKRHGDAIESRHILKGESWRLSDEERGHLVQLLSTSRRPTAIFAGGYYLALDVYAAAQTVGMEIGKELSVIGVDDPPSAAHLSPAMSTMRQPLVQTGHTAVSALGEHIRHPDQPMHNQTLRAELVIRRSTGAPAKEGASVGRSA